MILVRRALLVGPMFVLAACTTATPATQQPQTPPAATPTAAIATLVSPTARLVTAAPPAATTALATPVESPAESQAPATTPVPGSSLDPSLSDAGVVGRVTLANDTRNGWTGTHEIIGLASDGSDCSYSTDGDEFTALAWHNSAPDGMIHQMAVTVPTDEMPSNDGEQRAGIADGRVYVDFVSASGFGTAYSGDATTEGAGSVTLAVSQSGSTLTFTFTGATWDAIDFSGQMICAGMGGE